MLLKNLNYSKMNKKNLLLIIALLFSLNSLTAKQVDIVTAENVAKNFYLTTAKGSSLGQSMVLSVAYESKSMLNHISSNEIPLFYIYNINQTEGYVIVTADDNIQPILGYSESSYFDANDIPINMAKWLENYKKEIEYIINTQAPANDEIETKWRTLKNGTYASSSRMIFVNPLLTTTWSQSPYYNSLCPGGSVTGCVATAMAQVMKYWNHPAQGSGFHSYNENDYGTLSASFGGTTYNWSNMPNAVNSNNTAVATLMYHCGVSVDMNYSPQVSGAWVANVYNPNNAATSEYALETYFNYSTALQGVLRSSYSEANWINLMKTELNAGRPILHAGFGTGGGHAFVCDGFDNNDYFHFNWGWGGNSDGYFWNNALNPGSLGTGGGSGGYNTGQHIIIGIQPAGGSGNATNIAMYSNITINPNPIIYGQSITVNADIINNGNATLFGEVTAALFDANYNFVEFAQTLNLTNGLPANNHYIGGITFSSTGLNATPGNYYIAIYVKPTGGSWQQVNNGSYQSIIPITINGANNNIKMYGSIAVSPTPVVENQALSIWLDVTNYGAAFNGKMSVDLHDIDGNWIQTINEKTNLSLSNNNHYINGLTFASSGLNVVPGTYLAAAWEQETGGSWQLIEGTANYPNPISITIVQTPLQADIYENNNTQSNAYNLPISFAGNSANKMTPGSNTHVGTDVDFYKIQLPVGYNYVINSRLHDSYDSGNGQTYTNDVLWSYNTGSGWSATYDDVLTTGNIVVNGGNTIYFQVAPYFQGNTGTYLFDINLTRTPTTITETALENNAITLFPNPANDLINLSFTNDMTIKTINIYNISGQQVLSETNKKQSAVYVGDLPNGAYLISVITNEGIWNGKVLINH
jgi:hypothetical protein